MTICAIWWEVPFGEKFKSYRESIILNVCMLPLCYCYVIFLLILHKLCFYKEAVLSCFMLISIFLTSSQKEDNSSNRMGGWVRSTFQAIQRIHEIEFSNASFMLSLHYRLCGFYKDYASIKKQYYMVLWFLFSFMLPNRRKRIR